MTSAPFVSSIVLATLMFGMLATTASAQCTNLTSNPAPTTEEYGANRVRLKYLATGPGGGDDRPEISKSTFIAPIVYDPQTTHTTHFTIRKNTIAGTVMWTASMPPDLTHWTSTTLSNGNVRWRYVDPAAPYGIKKAQLVEYAMGGLHIWTYVRGVNANVIGAPLMPGVDSAHLTVEIENLGTGVCYEGTATQCSGTGNTQTCIVP